MKFQVTDFNEKYLNMWRVSREILEENGIHSPSEGGFGKLHESRTFAETATIFWLASTKLPLLRKGGASDILELKRRPD